jgi:leucyl aminopeptidase
VCVVGLGKPEDFTLDRVRQAAAFGAKALRQAGSKKIATVVPGLGAGSIDAESAGQATAEGLVLGLWRFRKYRTDGNSENEKTEITDATLVERDAGKLDALKRGAARGKIFAEATNLARELANEPSNNLTPTRLANIARSMAREHKLEFHVIDRVKAKRLGMGAFLGVAQGSEEPPAMIVLRYWGAGKEAEPGLGLIGKGITFDSGGISLKPGEGMQDMKGDMSGGAAVIAAIQAIAQLKPKINVTGIVAATENMPSGKAYKPGDILKAMNGKTIEVANTDAEGRLILADAVAYASGTLKLSPVVDAATLTGAIATALGNVRTGLFSNDDELAKTLGEIGEQTGEKMWRMPMDDEYAEMIKSDWADVRNIGTSRQAGAIIGAWFIRKFVAEKTPWAHLDIAGAANLGQGKDQGYVNKWGTGVPTRTFIELALRLASQK